MVEPLHFQRDGAIVVLSMDRPPANATGLALRCALQAAISDLAKDESVRAVVLTGKGRFFCAGADIGELGTPDNQAAPVLRDLVDALESFPKPLVAALNGIAYGGGLELALGCSHRVAAPGARLALPEVKLGLIPGAGGTQRLPRLIGVRRALDMILGGEAMSAEAALAVGLVDALLEEPFPENVVGWCRALDPGPAPRRSRGPLRPGTAQHAALRCVEAAHSEPFERGLRLERELITELIAGEESKALRKTFLTKGGER